MSSLFHELHHRKNGILEMRPINHRRITTLIVFSFFLIANIGKGPNLIAQSIDDIENKNRNLVSLVEVFSHSGIDKELELTEFQCKELESLFKSQIRKSVDEEILGQISGILLPHQFLRLRQIRLQISSNLTSDPSFGLYQLFEPSDLPNESLRELFAKNKRERENELSRVQDRLSQQWKSLVARQLSRLSPVQQLKYYELFGEPVVTECDVKSMFDSAVFDPAVIARSSGSALIKILINSGEIEIFGKRLSPIDPQNCANRSLLPLIQKDWVLKELNLTPTQIEELQSTLKSFRKRNPEETSAREFGEIQIGEVFSPFDFPLAKTLQLEDLPLTEKQVVRLNQLSLQYSSRSSRSIFCGLDRVSHVLDLSDEQLETAKLIGLEEKKQMLAKLKKDFSRIQDLIRSQHRKVLGLLSPAQRESYHQIFGELFPELCWLR